MAKIKSNLWVETYRPRTVKDIVLPKEFSKYFNNIVKTRRTSKLTIVFAYASVLVKPHWPRHLFTI